ncbi:MAG: cytochrome b/b6 domain-containing protein [Acidobacteria bacterium]|nr:cytochrome b/b6 domain-containing protein [Acidobacteriota bacterium]
MRPCESSKKRATLCTSPEVISFRPSGSATPTRAAYEHPLVIRYTHWLTAVSLVVLTASGLQIFAAFPSFGSKVPQEDLLTVPPAVTIGGWLGGALQWHFTFMWIFIATGAVYIGYQIVSGRYRMVLFTPRDIPGVWPMVRHYFFFKARPPVVEPYNPLQKLAYTTTVLLGVASVLTGLVLYNPVQFSGLAWAMGGFPRARIWHALAMCGFLAFLPGHLLMVALHGWKNFVAMLVGWKKDPEYSTSDSPGVMPKGG